AGVGVVVDRVREVREMGLLSGRDATMRLWDSAAEAELATVAGQTDGWGGVLELRDGRLLSWGRDHTLRLWDSTSGAELATLTGESGRAPGGEEVRKGRLLSWGRNRQRRLGRSEGAAERDGSAAWGSGV